MSSRHDDPTIPPSSGEPAKFERIEAPLAEQPGQTIGPYRLLEVLGEGGFGVVYLAERREPIVQRVALKVIKPGMDSRAVVARFEQERQALAVMDHPNVAKVFDAGTTPAALGSRPYFVMEYVQGEPITTYCDRHTLSTRKRLELFIPVCEAVQHAHTKGIIHRDLKPSNVLVTVRRDGSGSELGATPKVIDFGVAKAVSQTLTQKTIFTERGQLIGTPEYMSPEQAEMGATDIDTRTDVYSLGVLLYELLSGGLPFDPKSLRSAGFAEIQRIIREVDPPRPSTRLSRMGDSGAEAARKRQADVDALQKELHRELEWIPLRAMRKDRAERYRTPAELADDIRNYLDGRPLIAGPETATYRFRKFVRRRRGLVAAVLAVALALVAGIVGTSAGLVRANRAAAAERVALKREAGARASAEAAASAERAAREQEASQRKRSEATSKFLHDMLASIDPEKSNGRDVTVREIIDDAAKRVNDSLQDDPVAQASLRETLGETYHQLGRYHEAREQLIKALQLRAAALGPEDRETLTTKYNLAAVALALREVPEATRLLHEVLEGRRRTLGESSEDTLVTRSLLGFATQLSGDNEAALKIYRETLDAQKQALGPGNKATLETMASIADVLQDLGRLEEAEKAAAEIVDAATAAQGPDGVTALMGKSICAAVLRDLGRSAESEALSREVLQAKRRIYGPEHAETLITENVLGQTLADQKKYDEAAALLRHCVGIATAQLGAENKVTLTYANNLAQAEHHAGHLDEAERLFRQILAADEKAPGPPTVPRLSTMNNLGLLLLERQKPQEAEAIFRPMLEGVEQVTPPDHWIRGQARLNIGECLKDQQKYAEAEKFMLAGYEFLARVLPAGHSRVLGGAKSLALLYKAWDKPDLEKQWAERAKAPVPDGDQRK